MHTRVTQTHTPYCASFFKMYVAIIQSLNQRGQVPKTGNLQFIFLESKEDEAAHSPQTAHL